MLLTGLLKGINLLILLSYLLLGILGRELANGAVSIFVSGVSGQGISAGAYFRRGNLDGF